MAGMELAEKLLNLPFVKGITGNSDYNLKAALVVEDFVAQVWFPELAKMAHAEGKTELGKLFENIGQGEQGHADALRHAMQKFDVS